MNIKPLYDRVVVLRLEEENKTSGGILIPDTVKDKPTKGKIIAAGEGTRDESGKIHPLAVKKNDIIIFGKWSGTEIKIDGVEYLIMKESDILGIVDESSSKKKAA